MHFFLRLGRKLSILHELGFFKICRLVDNACPCTQSILERTRICEKGKYLLSITECLKRIDQFEFRC